MKIVAINGSHRGAAGNTNLMVTAFLNGAHVAGAETVNILLAEKKLNYCRACKACWFNTPGKCALKDDMTEILTLLAGAEVRVLATPLYFDNISGMLKVFMDRLMVTASPYWGRDENGECQHLTTTVSPKLMLLANCGYPERTQFQVISHWIRRVARNAHTEVIGEIYAPQGALLSTQMEGVTRYLRALETAGREIAVNMKLTGETARLLNEKFVDDELYIQEVKRHVDGMLHK
jgi:FMN-dependent NADH-azoreductase